MVVAISTNTVDHLLSSANTQWAGKSMLWRLFIPDINFLNRKSLQVIYWEEGMIDVYIDSHTVLAGGYFWDSLPLLSRSFPVTKWWTPAPHHYYNAGWRLLCN